MEKTVVLLAKEAQVFFDEAPAPERMQVITAKDAGELIKFIFIYDPQFVVFNIANLSEDNYDALTRLQNGMEKMKYTLLFIRSEDEAMALVKAFEDGVNPYYLKLFNAVEKNSRILDFLEIRQARDEMSLAFSELKQANLEARRKNKQLQQAIHNVEKLATTDYLTGVYNRRYAIERIKQEIVRYKRNGRLFSFVICDIDNFKNINDTYGHAYGDLLLCEIASFLTESCREMDLLCRWGGDEFLFLMPETELKGARVFCERLRKKLAQKEFEYGHQKIHVTMTFGVAEYDEKGGANESIKNADDALLCGKNSGRNKVVAAVEAAKPV